jgi:hypothetical protein
MHYTGEVHLAQAQVAEGTLAFLYAKFPVEYNIALKYKDANLSTYIVRFVTFSPMTAYSFIVTVVVLQRKRSATDERDATFRTLHCQLRHIARCRCIDDAQSILSMTICLVETNHVVDCIRS